MKTLDNTVEGIKNGTRDKKYCVVRRR